MKILHIADLHIGKMLHGVSLIGSGDQSDWAEKFLELVRAEKPEVILIAGDIYDRSSNIPREAIRLVGHLLSELSGMEWHPAVMVSAGNHDSGPMVEYLGEVVERQNIYVAGEADREIRHVTVPDPDGEVTFWLVPYVFPAEINRLLGTDYRDYDSAFRAYLAEQNIDFTKRNVIAAHQNVTAFGKDPERGGSETTVGGVGGIDYTAFDGFEYAALGHIHAAQAMGRSAVRYAGSPLCYHFSELKHPKKGPVLIDLGPKGTEPALKICELEPLHPMREITGTLSEIEKNETYSVRRNEYIRIVLKPEEDGNGAAFGSRNEEERLRALFRSHGSLVLDFAYDIHPVHSAEADIAAERIREKPMEEQFADFWQKRMGGLPDTESMELLRFIAEQERNSVTAGEIPTDAEVDAILAFAAGQEG